MSTDRRLERQDGRRRLGLRIELDVTSVAENRTKNVAQDAKPTAIGRGRERRIERLTDERERRSEVRKAASQLEMRTDLLDFGRVEEGRGRR